MRSFLCFILLMIVSQVAHAQQDSLYIDFTGFLDEGFPLGEIQEITFSGASQDSIVLTLNDESQRKYLIEDIGELTFNAPPGYTVPVELVSLNGRVEGSVVYLNWSTRSETNNSGFEVEQFRERHWVSLGFVPGKGTTTVAQQYTFKVAGVDNQMQFRLKQIDLNGTSSFSNILIIDTAPIEFKVSQNYPNPFNPSTKISFQLPTEGKVQIVLYDMLGRRIQAVETPELPAGLHQHELNAGSLGLSSGIYYLQFTFKKNTVQKKITLVK